MTTAFFFSGAKRWVFVCLFVFKRECASDGGWWQRKREGEAQADSTLRAEPDVGLDFITPRS